MKKSLGWSTAVLSAVLLFSVVSLSAQSKSSTNQTQSQSTANIFAVPSTIPSGALTISGHAVYLMDHPENDGDDDGDDNDYHHKWHHDPTPEPSTLLSFGAAILIGGAVVYSRRLRKSK